MNPTTEEQQILYNQFIEAFGTHYISSVIMAGVINIYTFVNQKSYTQYNYSKISYEISLFIKDQMIFSANKSKTTTSKWNRTNSLDFEDSQMFIVYQPPINNNDSESIWSLWTYAIDEHPYVINRTLRPLTDLLNDYPEIQTHLQITTDYYQKYGSLPTLADLNHKRHSRSLSTSIRLIPGLDIVGCGFDILSVQSKMCLIDITNTSNKNVYTDAFNMSLNYLLPNGFYAIDTPDSLSLDFSIQTRSIDDYFRHTFYSTHSDNFGFLSFGASHQYKSIETLYRRYYEENFYLALRLLQIKWYTLSVIAFPYPRLNDVAKAAITKLPNTFNPNITGKFEQFFSTFGTHFVQSADLGGLLQAEIWYKSCLLYEKSETWINEQSSKFWWFFETHQSSSSHQLSIDQQFRENSMFSSKLIGGSQFMNTTLWQEWAPTIKLNPKPIQYRLKPIYTLLPEGTQRTALVNALAYLRTTVDADAKEYISQLKEFSPPPDKGCGLTKRKRDLLLEETYRHRRSLASNANLARQGLCPIIGYNGSFYPGEKRKRKRTTRAISKIMKLPCGVGMTIDISTGKLMLPVLELSYPTDSTLRIWKDESGTGQSFQIPYEITLSPVNINRDNKPTSYIYPTPMQFAAVWTRVSGSGSWVGGQLGYTQSVLDVNLKYFSTQQATAITQHPLGLYRLEVNNLTLNEYDREALKLLPADFDESIYNDFMDTWGTHIAVSTFVDKSNFSFHSIKK